VLLAVTLACYWPVRHFSFLNYDDDRYVTGNPMMVQGLSWEGFRWAFRTLTECNWHPVTWLSHSLDCQLFGLDAGAHHAMNLGLHAANVLLLFYVLARLTGSPWPSAFVAALFGWHPTHVQSVAWVAERKDLLSTFFFLLTLWAYVRHVEVSSLDPGVLSPQSAGRKPQPRQDASRDKILQVSRFYLLALAFFALGLMSKPMLVTLPFVLLLLDWWPLGRFASLGSKVSSLESSQHALRSTRRATRTTLVNRLLLEKLPFFALAAASCVITYIAQSRGGAVAPVREVSAALRVENVLVAYIIYVLKLFWPARLAVFYPMPPSFPFREVAGAGLALGGVCALASWQVRARPWLAVGWFWFLGTLVPVIGLVQVGDQAMADRYTYIPYIGLSIALVWGVMEVGTPRRDVRDCHKTDASARRPYLRGMEALRSDHRLQAVAAGLGGLGLAACFLQTRFELQFWQDSEHLFKRALAVTGESILAHSSLAAALTERGELEEAERHYRRVLELAPDSALAHSDLGVALAKEGKKAEAEARLREAIQLGPRLGGAYNNLGQLLTDEGRLDEAATVLRTGLSFAPGDAPAHCKLGFVWALQGDLPKATDEFKEGSRLAPQDAGIQETLAKLLIRLGGHAQALDYFLAQAQARPEDPLPRSVLARLYLDQDQPREAVAALRAAISLAPRAPAYLNQLARVYATHPSPEVRDGPEAVRLAERACRLSGGQAGYLDTLSAAYAEAGRFADAVQAAKQALDMALASHDEKTAQAAARKLEQYRARL